MKRANRTERLAVHHFTVDLHGMHTYEALHTLDRELNHHFIRGATGGRVICGHGTGALLRAVGGALAQSPLVVDHRRDGDLAAFLVELHAVRDLEMG